ncbi:MAG: hypothetical protein JWR52_455 [Marmoricola sp.]|nr:hypothetical protein [Marmoricola sp.]
MTPIRRFTGRGAAVVAAASLALVPVGATAAPSGNAFHSRHQVEAVVARTPAAQGRTSHGFASVNPTSAYTPPFTKRGTQPVVEHGVRTVLVQWGDWSTDTTGSVAAAQTFLTSVGGSSYQNILNQYDDKTGQTVGTTSTFLAKYVDPSQPTKIDINNDAAALAEVNKAAAALGVTADANTQFVLMLGTNATFASRNSGYCAYHGHGTSGQVFDLIPNLGTTKFKNGCLGYGSGVQKDAETTTLSHEYSEAATDPLVGNSVAYGWTDATGYEIGDFCNYAGVAGPGGVKVQYEWSNADNACVDGR